MFHRRVERDATRSTSTTTHTDGCRQRLRWEQRVNNSGCMAKPHLSAGLPRTIDMQLRAFTVLTDRSGNRWPASGGYACTQGLPNSVSAGDMCLLREKCPEFLVKKLPADLGRPLADHSSEPWLFMVRLESRQSRRRQRQQWRPFV